MKVSSYPEPDSSIIDPVTAEELGFPVFLSLFSEDFPLIPPGVLRPMNRETGTRHFRELIRLEKDLGEAGLSTESLLEKSRLFPFMDDILPFFESGNPTFFHIFELGRFLKTEKTLSSMEAAVFKPDDSLDVLYSILEKNMLPDFSGLKPEDPGLFKEIEDLEKSIRSAVREHEAGIHAKTGLRMSYPYPRILHEEGADLSLLSSCPGISIHHEEDMLRLEHRLDPKIRSLKDEHAACLSRIHEKAENRLRRMNKETEPHNHAFHSAYMRRKELTRRYFLINVKQTHGLVFPEITDEIGCRLEGAVLPSVRDADPAGYIPLDIDLKKGADILYGANMSGKTTVLRTVFFHLTAARLGLPLPAKEAAFHYPEKTALHLATAGSIKKGLSGFGEELGFFSGEPSPGAILLVDELFHSTDPVNGRLLSEIFIRHYSGRQILFFCTTHFPEILKMKGIRLLRMEDVEISREKDSISDPTARKSFRVTVPDASETADLLSRNTKPLRIALHFPLPLSIKKEIRKVLEEDPGETTECKL